MEAAPDGAAARTSRSGRRTLHDQRVTASTTHTTAPQVAIAKVPTPSARSQSGSSRVTMSSATSTPAKAATRASSASTSST